MRVTRRTSLALLSGAGTIWAMFMVVGGAWLLFDGDTPWTILSPRARSIGGILAVTAGQFLFMYLVADRWFPRATKAITWPLEIGASALLVGGAVWGIWEIGRALLAPGA